MWSALLFGYSPSVSTCICALVIYSFMLFSDELCSYLPLQVSGLSISLADAGYVVIASLVSITAHEFGHAVAATRSILYSLLERLNLLLCGNEVAVFGII